MATALFGLASVIAAVASFLIFWKAKSAIHEILGMVLGLICAVYWVGGVVTYQLDRLPERIAKALEARVPTPPPRDDEMPVREPPDPAWLRRVAVVAMLIFIAVAALYAWSHWAR